MSDDIWYEIEGILQNLTLIKNGVTSESFATQTLKHMKTACESSEVEQALIELSKDR